MPLIQGQVCKTAIASSNRSARAASGPSTAPMTHAQSAVAVKENLDTSPEAQRQFQTEAHIVAGLRHPTCRA